AQFLAALPDSRSALAEVCDQVPEWSRFLENAARNGLHDVVFQALTRLGRELPPAVHKHALRFQASQRLLHERLIRALGEALSAFAAAGVPVATLKGPVLAERIYPACVLRPSVDLDLLVASRDIYRAAAVLEGMGYHGAQGPGERYYREHHHHLHFQRMDGP